MNNRFLRWVVLACLALLLIACQPIRPLATARQPAATTSTYADEHGFFTVDYPADWIAHGYLFADAPFPHVAIGSHQEIIDLSTAEQPLPADQIGVALMVIPRELFADAGITAETPLVEVAPLLLMAMAGDDAELMAGLIGAATRITHFFAKAQPARSEQPLPGLSEREREILELMSRHYTNPEIAQQLGIGEKTIRNHVSNIFNKLQVATRAQAIDKARQAGLGGEP